jgi:Putative Flp pilus-assembly TadE/G-like
MAQTSNLATNMRAASVIRSFLGNREGQFAILMALLTLPVLAAVGLAVDYSYAVQVRSRLRAANDAAALYAATEYKKNGVLPSDAKIYAYLESNFGAPNGDPLPVIKKIEVNDLVVTIDTEVVAPVFIMQVFGNADTDVSATSSVTVGQDTNLQIALALDNTGSMLKDAGINPSDIDPDGNLLPPGVTTVSRIDALKVAALRFNNAVLNNVGLKGRAAISVVPFARYVNVGLSNRNASWITVSDDIGGIEHCDMVNEITGYDQCVDRVWDNDGVSVPYQDCQPVYGSNKIEQCWREGQSVWNGCVGSRPEPMNLKQEYSGSKFTGLMNEYCNKEILPLTDDPVKVANHITSMWANDFTYIPEGVMWGWRVLTDQLPFQSNDAAAAGKELRKIMVLMTDGENQAMNDLPDAPTHHILSHQYHDAAYYDSEVLRANVVTREACENAKRNKIEMYVVSFGTDIGTAAKQMLEDCATDSSHYFDATNAKKLIEAFDTIAYRVSAIYLSN